MASGVFRGAADAYNRAHDGAYNLCVAMHIFVAGATGALGRELLPMLAGHAVTGMTRSRPHLVRSLGAEPVVADIYDRDRTLADATDVA
ncbi:MAG: hypothetical protein M3O50_06050 [Myxococcota bacterium]|nr:hypothetical protein [Myxococcota bacterium]